MCLTPLKIRNPTKRIDYRGGQKLILEVPCGKCAQCLTNKRQEWYVRSMFHCNSTINNGGYVYFDTLTYSDEFLPKLSHFVPNIDCDDFSCFNHNHFRLFLKNLRRQLNYKYKKNNLFTYFLVSEYGLDDRYTHRPHYHVLFFVNGYIDPLFFSHLVSKCWPYGRTDGIDYKPLAYVADHVYGKDLGFPKNTFKSTLSICMYVSKYINKSSRFTETLNKRLGTVVHLCKTEDEFRALKRNVDMFHRQSQGFGISYLKGLSLFDLNLLSSGVMSFVNTKGLSQTMPLPMYYKRHLFYDSCKRDDGTRYWQLNTRGVEHFKSNVDSVISSITKNYYDIYTNLSPEQRSNVDFLLGCRSLRDFAAYKYLYQYRLMDLSTVDLRCYDTNFCFNDDQVECIVNSSFVNSFAENDVYHISEDKQYIMIPFNNVPFYYFKSQSNHYYMTLDSFIKNYTISEHSSFAFDRFDALDKYFAHLDGKRRKDKQDTYDFIEEQREKYKLLKAKCYA